MSETHIQGKTVAVCGKGGVGKTAFTAMLTKALVSDPSVGRLLVVDADPAMGLLYALGVSTDKSIGSIRERILNAAEKGTAGEKAEVAETLDYLVLNALQEADGFSYLAMGHMNAKGCFCSVNDLLHDSLDQLVNQFDTIVIDGEAGLEQINRQVTDHVNTLLLVTDSSWRGQQTVKSIEKLVDDGYVPECERMGVIINRTPGDSESNAKLVASFNLPVYGFVPLDDEVENFDRRGASLLKLPSVNPAYRAVMQVIEAINSSAR
jgi:CO dehydrogenase maturation factor